MCLTIPKTSKSLVTSLEKCQTIFSGVMYSKLTERYAQEVEMGVVCGCDSTSVVLCAFANNVPK